MKITLIFTLLLHLSAAWAQSGLPSCDPNQFQLLADIEYYSFESKKKAIFTDPISFLTIKEKYKALKVEGPLKKATLTQKDLDLAFEIQGNSAFLDISTLNISLYKKLYLRVADSKGKTCEMVIDITRD